MKEICQSRYQSFGSEGQADKIKVLSLDAMYKAYDSGALKQRVN